MNGLLVDEHGTPIPSVTEQRAREARKKAYAVARERFFGSTSSFLEALLTVDQDPKIRSIRPFRTHPWVSAAAQAIALSASQAPFRVYRDTSVKRGDRRCGRDRAAMRRWASPEARILGAQKGVIDPVDDHELTRLFTKPNVYLHGTQLMQLTLLWVVLQGDVKWVKTDDSGSPVSSQQPTRLWPCSPNHFTPVQQAQGLGELIGYDFRPPNWFPIAPDRAREMMRLDPQEVVTFKNPDPEDLLRGFSRLTGAAEQIRGSIAVDACNRELWENGAVPRGFFKTTDPMSPAERDDFLADWDDRHRGVHKVGNIGILEGEGADWIDLAKSSRDMEGSKQQEWFRDSILASMLVPKGVLGVSETVNYATLLGQTRNFWDISILPVHRLIETALDAQLLFAESDEFFCAFDYTQVEAMQGGLMERLERAEKLCSGALHVPPRIAFQMVGIEIPEYEADDVAFVPSTLSTVDAVLAGGASLGSATTSGKGEDSATDETSVKPSKPKKASSASSYTLRARASEDAQRRAWLRAHADAERGVVRAYRDWVASVQRQTMTALDEELAAEGKRSRVVRIDWENVIPALATLRDSIKAQLLRAFKRAAESSRKLTSGLLDSIELPDAKLDAAVARRITAIARHVPRTIRKALQKVLKEALTSGETVQGIRKILAKRFAFEASSARALMVARTETTGVMNDVRIQGMKEAGVEAAKWSTANDEHVRAAHVALGTLEAQRLGTNWASLIGRSDVTLEFPGDARADAGLVVNCRCTLVVLPDSSLLNGQVNDE